MKLFFKSWNRQSILYGVIILAIGIISLIITVSLSHNKQTISSQASEGLAACAGPLHLAISIDGKNFGSTVSLPLNVPTTYYLKVVSNAGAPCSINFEILKSDGTIVKNWGPYKSNTDGVARIDIDKGWSKAENIVFAVRPKGSEGVWSNFTTVDFNENIKPSIINVDTTSYFKQKPGNVYIYSSINHWYPDPAGKEAGYPGLTYLQMESKIEMCGRTMIPWRFLKSNEYSYWGNKYPYTYNGQVEWVPGDRDMRWYIADPTAPDGSFGAYKDYIWSYGFEEYIRDNTLGMKSPVSSQSGRSYTFRSGVSTPNYNLGRKTFEYLPFIEYNDQLTGWGKPGFDCDLEYSAEKFRQEGNALSGWKLRADMDTVNIANPGVEGGFNYSGPALRVDYYEGHVPFTDSNQEFHRETWYFVKDIGLVKMLADNFNKYAGADETVAPYCVDDSDCWADTIEKPTRSMTLKYYFDNPVLQVQVSGDNSTYSSDITIAQGSRYYLKITNVAYTGWLEAQLNNNTPIKWLWAENGLVTIDENMMKNVPIGTYPSKFRIWIPNDAYPNQRRVDTNTIPFSNLVGVNIVSIGPTATPILATATVIPPTSVPTNQDCSLRPKGDANCDDSVDSLDYVCWKSEYVDHEKPSVCVSSDFNSLMGVDSFDFVIWFTNFLLN